MTDSIVGYGLQLLGAIAILLLVIVALNAIFGLYYVPKDKYQCTRLTVSGECYQYTRKEAP